MRDPCVPRHGAAIMRRTPYRKSTPDLERLSVEVRGLSVMLDVHLAALYGGTTSALNQAVARNRARFPADFAFRLTRDELRSLESQNVISKTAGRGGRRTRLNAFT